MTLYFDFLLFSLSIDSSVSCIAIDLLAQYVMHVLIKFV